MATYVAPIPQVSASRAEREARGWTSWITTTDHKRIGIMYIVTTFVFFCLGGVEALMMRLQLGSPNNTVVTPQIYNQLFTMHGTTMVFLFVVPMMAGLANYFLPLMIGARDMAFPRLNALSYWLLLFGGIVFYASVFFQPPEAGWFSYTPLSGPIYSPSNGQDAWIFLIHITGISSLVWAHHMFTTPVPTIVLGFFMLSSFLIAVPTGVKIFNWIATLWRGSIQMKTALFFAAGFIAIFVIGGITGIFLAVFPVDWQ